MTGVPFPVSELWLCLYLLFSELMLGLHTFRGFHTTIHDRQRFASQVTSHYRYLLLGSNLSADTRICIVNT